jgi:hypothetical protein
VHCKGRLLKTRGPGPGKHWTSSPVSPPLQACTRRRSQLWKRFRQEGERRRQQRKTLSLDVHPSFLVSTVGIVTWAPVVPFFLKPMTTLSHFLNLWTRTRVFVPELCRLGLWVQLLDPSRRIARCERAFLHPLFRKPVRGQLQCDVLSKKGIVYQNREKT